MKPMCVAAVRCSVGFGVRLPWQDRAGRRVTLASDPVDACIPLPAHHRYRPRKRRPPAGGPFAHLKPLIHCCWCPAGSESARLPNFRGSPNSLNRTWSSHRAGKRRGIQVKAVASAPTG